MRIGDLTANATVNENVPWYQQILNTLTQAGAAYLTIEQQRELNKLNLLRAQQGQPPLDSTQYQTGVNVGLGGSTQNTLITVAAIGGGVYLLSKLLSSGNSRRR